MIRREASQRGRTLVPGNTPSHRPDRPAVSYSAPTRNRRSVWTVSTRPYYGAHYAVFPPDLIEPCILAGTSEYGACADCGAPWERIMERISETAASGSGGNLQQQGKRYVTRSVGWRPTCTCACDEIVPSLVLDPFAGSGTTGEVALCHKRHFVGIELNGDYLRDHARPRLEGIAREVRGEFKQLKNEIGQFEGLPLLEGLA